MAFLPCNSGNGGGSGLKVTTLWTNPDPTTAFNEQDVILNDAIENYDFYQIVYAYSSSYTNMIVDAMMVGKEYRTQASTDRSGVLVTRSTALPNLTTIHIYPAYYRPTYGGSLSSDNNCLIPVRIIGYKK